MDKLKQHIQKTISKLSCSNLTWRDLCEIELRAAALIFGVLITAAFVGLVSTVVEVCDAILALIANIVVFVGLLLATIFVGGGLIITSLIAATIRFFKEKNNTRGKK